MRLRCIIGQLGNSNIISRVKLRQTITQLGQVGFDDVGHRLGLTTGAQIGVCKAPSPWQHFPTKSTSILHSELTVQTTRVDAFPTSSANHLFVGLRVNNRAVKHWCAHNDSTRRQVDTRRQCRRRNENTQGAVTERTLDYITFVKRQTYDMTERMLNQSISSNVNIAKYAHSITPQKPGNDSIYKMW